jgi:hypothetical protein
MNDKREGREDLISKQACALPPDQKLDLLHTLCRQISPDQRRDVVLFTVEAMQVEDRKTVVRDAIQGLPPREQENVTFEMIAAGYIPPPDTTTRDKIWMTIIGSFSFVLVAGFLALAAGMFVPVAKDGVAPSLILSMFMSAVGFIGGLFVPSPTSGRGFGTNRSGNGG